MTYFLGMTFTDAPQSVWNVTVFSLISLSSLMIFCCRWPVTDRSCPESESLWVSSSRWTFLCSRFIRHFSVNLHLGFVGPPYEWLVMAWADAFSHQTDRSWDDVASAHRQRPSTHAVRIRADSWSRRFLVALSVRPSTIWSLRIPFLMQSQNLQVSLWKSAKYSNVIFNRFISTLVAVVKHVAFICLIGPFPTKWASKPSVTSFRKMCAIIQCQCF